MQQRVLILGADGFIGRHIAFALRAAGYHVIASARAPAKLAAMGFEVLPADLTNPATHSPAFWASHLAGGTHLVIASGLLTGRAQAFNAVHVSAPSAAIAALNGGQAVLISAVGIEAETDFARYRRAAEGIAAKAGATILRPGLVLADSSYGGSSLLRALAALPLVAPVVGTGTQPFNPVHASDLAQIIATCLATPPGPGPGPNGAWEVGGPQTLSQSDLIDALRGWLGLPARPQLHLPLGLARRLGKIGDALRLGPISATAVAQLEQGVLAHPAPLLAKINAAPRAVREFITARPAGTQDLWQARLYLIKPMIRLVLALMWLGSALLGLLLPATAFLHLFPDTPIPDTALALLARLGGVADLALGLALLRNWQPKTVAWLQIAMVAGYTAGLTLLAPQLWLAPFGEVLKNLPILALLLVHLALVEER